MFLKVFQKLIVSKLITSGCFCTATEHELFKVIINFMHLYTYVTGFWKTYRLHTNKIITISDFAPL